MFNLSSKHWPISRLRWVFLSSILVFSMMTVVFYFPNSTTTNTPIDPEPYFGVSFCGNTTDQAKLLIDKTKNYTNLFVLQSGPVSKNETATNIICDYAVDAGLDFIVFLGWFDTEQPWQLPWVISASNRWGESFLGVYFFDEAGGIQIDQNWTRFFHRIEEFFPEYYNTIEQYIEEVGNPNVLRDYEEAKNRFIDSVVNHIELGKLINNSITAFTADYTLYWFDYLAGYDTVFVELGWNHDSRQHIGLCRGAANVQDKDWGTIIVWNDRDLETNNTGYYKSGPEMLEDMYVSYETGARYIIIFNYPTNPPGNPYGILTDDHFDAMQQFWNYMEQNPENYGKTTAKNALVLPENYAWGMRHLEDRIWGYWGPDEKSEQIWNLSQHLLDQHGFELDIVYDDPNYPLDDIYQEIIYWNSTG